MGRDIQTGGVSSESHSLPMRRRIDVASDIAMLGVWDEEAGRSAARSATGKRENLLKEVAAGRLVFLEVGSDFGGSADLYVGSNSGVIAYMSGPEPAVRGLLKTDGHVIIGGMEDYGSASPSVTGSDSTVLVKPGTYEVSIFRYEEVAEMDAPDFARAFDQLSPEDQAYHKRISTLENRQALGAWALILLFPLVAWISNWKWALGVTAAALICYGWICQLTVGRKVEKDARWKDINLRLHRIMQDSGAPLFVITILPVSDENGEHQGEAKL